MHTNIVIRQLLENDARLRLMLREVNKDLPRSLDQEELAQLARSAERSNQLVLLTYNSGSPDVITEVRQGSPYHAGTGIPPERTAHLYFFRLVSGGGTRGPYQYQSVDQMMDPSWGRGRRVIKIELMPDPG